MDSNTDGHSSDDCKALHTSQGHGVLVELWSFL